MPFDLPGDAGLADVELLQLEVAAELGRVSLPTSSPLMAVMSSGLRESLSQTFWLMTPMLGRMKGFSRPDDRFRVHFPALSMP